MLVLAPFSLVFHGKELQMVRAQPTTRKSCGSRSCARVTTHQHFESFFRINELLILVHFLNQCILHGQRRLNYDTTRLEHWTRANDMNSFDGVCPTDRFCQNAYIQA